MSTDPQRSITTAIWSDNWFEKQSSDVKLLWLYLLTHQKSNMLGIYEISETRTAFETSIPLERVTQGFRTLANGFKALFAADFVWVVNFAKHQRYNDNMKVSARRVFEELPENVRSEFAVMGSELSPNPWETLCNGLGIPLVKLENRNRKLEIENTLSLSPARAHTRAFEFDQNSNPEPSNAFLENPEDAPKGPVRLPGTFEIPSLKKVIEYANMRGFNEAVATRYFDMRQADNWQKSTKGGDPRPIADWNADFRLKAESIREELNRKAIPSANGSRFEQPNIHDQAAAYRSGEKKIKLDFGASA